MESNDKKTRASLAVAQALQMIEEAQGTLGKAAATICDVAGLGHEWQRIGKVYEAAQSAWYALQKRAEELGANGKLEMVH